MTPFGWASLYLMAGATIAAWQSWRLAQVDQLTAADHVVAAGVVCLWPLVLSWLLVFAVISRTLARRP